MISDSNTIKIEVLKHPTDEDWMLCKECTLVTVGKDAKTPPTVEWKKKILKARHSPIRTLQFCFRISNIPYCNSTHLVRHVHSTPFVKTQRNDRQSEYDRESAPQNAPVDMCWYMNAEELITIMNKRLCGQADVTTRNIVRQIREAVLEVNPEFEDELVPMCIRNGGVCHEFSPCGYNKSYVK